MGFFKRLGMIIYIVLMLGAGAVLLFASLKVFPSEQWMEAVDLIRGDMNYQIAVGVVGGIFVILAISAPFRMAGDLSSGRTITFQNPDGEVTVSISAIEDYIRKVARNIPDVSNVKSKVTFNKKGINIFSNVNIRAGSNIPEVMERIQMEARDKLQAMLGVEGNINMTLSVNKIIGEVPDTVDIPHELSGPNQAPFQ